MTETFLGLCPYLRPINSSYQTTCIPALRCYKDLHTLIFQCEPSPYERPGEHRAKPRRLVCQQTLPLRRRSGELDREPTHRIENGDD
jgi:hypothetical protein